MDVGPPMSRDPRLFNRGSRPSLPSRLSQTEVPHQPLSGLPDAQNKVPSDYFISGITDLVQTAVFAATSKTEREQLQKKRSTTEDLLQKAKAHSGFPSTVEFFQHTRKDEDSVLASINKKIKDYETNYKRLEADLKNTWAAHTASQVSRSEDKVPQMQHDLKLANDKISNLYGDIAGLIDRNKAADVELRNLQEILSAQKKGFADYTNSLGLLSRDLNDQLKKQNEHSTQLQQLEAATKEPETGATSEIKTALDDVSLQYKTLEQKTAGFIEKLGSLSSSYQRISALPDQVNQTLKDQQQKLDGVVNSQAANPKLENVVDILNHKLEDLEEIQRTKDDLQFAEMEDIKKILNTATEEHKKLSGRCERWSAFLGIKIQQFVDRVCGPANVRGDEGIVSFFRRSTAAKE
ncbi:hypothetical protein BDW59DRAFT_109143 [Aspergillus cavernicola]|uniref:Uncharacterized protein n=1 Tax=Aspergillus cavernicola TaxID=176166 RepID=A0ABR4I1X0_9EURO